MVVQPRDAREASDVFYKQKVRVCVSCIIVFVRVLRSCVLQSASHHLTPLDRVSEWHSAVSDVISDK